MTLFFLATWNPSLVAEAQPEPEAPAPTGPVTGATPGTDEPEPAAPAGETEATPDAEATVADDVADDAPAEGQQSATQDTAATETSAASEADQPQTGADATPAAAEGGAAGAEEAEAEQDEAAITRSMMDAREHMERGQALYQQERYIESAEEFLRAYEAQPFAAFLYNAGVSYEKVGDPGRAADYFARYLQADPQVEDAEALRDRIAGLRSIVRAREAEKAAELAAQALANAAAQQSSDGAETTPETSTTGGTEAAAGGTGAQDTLLAARQRVAELEREIAASRSANQEIFKSLLSIQSKPEDATIRLLDAEGNEVARGEGSPFAQTLDEGRYKVLIEHPKYRTISTPVRVSPGKVYVIIVELSQGKFLGYLRVVSDVPGARLFVDDREQGSVGATPYQNAIDTGVHHLWVEKPGYQVVERDIEVGVGEDVTLRINLTRLDHGRLRVVANRRDARVAVDGKDVGQVPLEVNVPGGAHEVVVSAPDMKDWTETVVIRNGQLTPVRVRMRPAVGRAGAWVTGLFSAATLGVGITGSLMGEKLEKEVRADRNSGVLSSDDPRLLRGWITYIATDTAYGLSALFGALSTYYFLRDPLPDSEGRVLAPRDWTRGRHDPQFTLTPTLGPERAGAQLRWSF